MSEYVGLYIAKNNDGFIRWSDLENHFSVWFKENCDKNVPNSKTLKTYFENKVFFEQCTVHKKDNLAQRGWSGFSLKNDN